MSMSNVSVIERYKNGRAGKSESGMLVSYGHILYSFNRGRFTVAVRRIHPDGREWHLLNGDRHTIVTNKHVSLTWDYFKDQPRVSFSALQAAGLDYDECQLVDHWPDEYGRVSPEDGDAFTNFVPPVGAVVTVYRDQDTNEITQKVWHRIGSVVLRQDGYDYLCSMDEGQYFISKLPHEVESVVEAFEILKPREVVEAERDGIPVKRQGEWFFIPSIFKRSNFHFMTNRVPLPITRPGSNPHLVSHLYVTDLLYERHMYPLINGVFVSGIVSHREHRRLVLDDGVIYLAARNTELGSWSASGRVD